MTNIVKISSESRRYKEVTEWITRLDRGLTDSEEETLREWMAARPENAEQLIQVAGLWDKMSTLSRLSDLFPEPKPRSLWRPLAASFVVVVVAGIWGYSQIIGQARTQAIAAASVVQAAVATHETAIGEQSTLVLSDGSHVVLNTNSLLKVRYTPQHRILMLLRGEVHINVASDLNRPLSVFVGDNIVQAVGTAFAVEITNKHNVQLVVTEGKVLVATRQLSPGTPDQITTAVLPASALIVTQGEGINLGSPGARVEAVSPEEIAVKLSWSDGNLIFRGETLEKAMDEVERYTDLEFIFVHDALKHEVISGRFKVGDVEGLLTVLRENIGIAYERTDDGRILLSSL